MRAPAFCSPQVFSPQVESVVVVASIVRPRTASRKPLRHTNVRTGKEAIVATKCLRPPPYLVRHFTQATTR